MNISDVISILEKLIIRPENNRVFVRECLDWRYIYFGKEREYEIDINEKDNKIILTYNKNYIVDNINNTEKYKLLELYEKLHNVCEDVVISNFNNFAFDND